MCTSSGRRGGGVRIYIKEIKHKTSLYKIFLYLYSLVVIFVWFLSFRYYSTKIYNYKTINFNKILHFIFRYISYICDSFFLNVFSIVYDKFCTFICHRRQYKSLYTLKILLSVICIVVTKSN